MQERLLVGPGTVEVPNVQVGARQLVEGGWLGPRERGKLDPEKLASVDSPGPASRPGALAAHRAGITWASPGKQVRPKKSPA